MQEVAARLDEHSSFLIVVHAHADLDALGSAIGLARLLDGPARVVVPDGIQSRAGRLPDELGVTLHDPSVVAGATEDCLVVVDAPSTDRIDPVSVDHAADVVVIDHHEPRDLAEEATATLIDTDTGATAALVARLAAERGDDLDTDAAVALAAGLLDDTGSLAGATAEECQLLGDLLDAAGDRAGILPRVLARDPSFSKRVAATKAVVRATGYRAGETLVLLTTVSGEQTAAAHALREAGADIALVVSERDSRTWVVGRADPEAVHLPSELFTPLMDEYGGDGGGHAGAGLAKLTTEATDGVRSKTLALLDDALDGSLSELS